MARAMAKAETPTSTAAVLASWPADKVERWPIEKLLPYARNARTHSAEQVDKLAASIKEFGWTVPVVVDEAGGLIAGHGRVLAAKKLELATVPTIVVHGWSDERKKAYRLADNQHALNSEWDEGLLKAELLDPFWFHERKTCHVVAGAFPMR